ncbi:microtubule-associated tumor suppressor candidate 2 isoform X2 [Periophthalmus magnuspinnatus]|uniref:microtubule-associated tumor suppressor candidate 2 isoform X2 n=1 Tax=Periophthalmus magnuspinnatus TaxID=409849 RepID=UPI0024363876|nr:microtubule-associated tumor suppressor candidate 2 isoform X2 [Periophthalmus magnuspinnatus]
MCDQREPLFPGEVRNNNHHHVGPKDSAGDANANDIQKNNETRTGDTVTLSDFKTTSTVQQRVNIYEENSLCEDLELAEFEMLECQELEDGEDFVGLTERKELPKQLDSKSNTTAQAASNKDEKSHAQSEISSETDIYLTCLSTISAVETAGKTTESWHVPNTISDDVTLASVSEKTKLSQPHNSVKSTMLAKDVDMNLNTAAHSKAQISSGKIQENKTVGCRNNNESNVRSDHKVQTNLESMESHSKMDKGTQADETPAVQHYSTSPAKTGIRRSQSSLEPKATNKQSTYNNALKKQNSFSYGFRKQPSFENSMKKPPSFDNSIKRNGSLENTAVMSNSSLEGRKPWGSPVRNVTTNTTRNASSSPRRRPSPNSPAKVQSVRAPSLERSLSPLNQMVKLPKTCPSTSLPKALTPPQKEEPKKNVRPKIITYVRKNVQAKPDMPNYGAPAKATAALTSSNILFDKYRQEIQKTGFYPPGMSMTGNKATAGTTASRLGSKSGSFHEDMSECNQKIVSQDGSSSVSRSPRTLRPQLGLGARQPATKSRVQQAAQRPGTMGHTAPTQDYHEGAGDQRRSGADSSHKPMVLKPGQSGLRPPGFSALPPSRLAAFGFTRSSSVSSVSSSQSNESGHSDSLRPSQHPSSGSDDTPHHKATASPGDSAPTAGRPHPPNAPSLHRRSLPSQCSSPLPSKREEPEAALPSKASPKRFAMISPKPQSPMRSRTMVVHGSLRSQDTDRQLMEQLQRRCQQQALQLQTLQAQLHKASLCLDVFTITTQHFCHKSESAIVKERELALELDRLRDEVAFSVAHWEQLQQEKEDVEQSFEAELEGLRAQQQRELGALEDRLNLSHSQETQRLQEEQRQELQELQHRQQQQIEEMSESHEASLMEMESAHSDTLATLHEEHTRTVKNLKMAHEQQRKSLEEDFEKIRLSLQDQVDTLTFQNRSLRDRAKRFEEALRRSTDEQIVDALAPYKHIEEDLKSLKEVLEMKNQQIHQQELKITELEKLAEKNVYLEERLQVLQQQNEDLKERIDKNLAVSRQLSEENANLQVHVEQESKEKKRLSRTNEELLWRLQTGELSPSMSPSSSPLHRASPAPGSPARPHSYHQ